MYLISGLLFESEYRPGLTSIHFYLLFEAQLPTRFTFWSVFFSVSLLSSIPIVHPFLVFSMFFFSHLPLFSCSVISERTFHIYD